MEFKDLLELFKQCKYEEVIKNARCLKDFNAIFLLIRSYVALKSYKEALNSYLDYRDILEKENLIESAKLYFYLLIKTNASDKKIYDGIEHFNGLNYRNQETEEFLCSLNEYIFKLKNEDKNNKKISLENLLSFLRSDNPEEVASALNELIENPDFKAINLPYIVCDILKSRNEFDLVYGMLFDFLIFVDYQDTFICRKDGKYYRLNPHEFIISKNNQNVLMHRVFKYLETYENDIVLLRYLIDFASRALFCVVPKFLDNDLLINSFMVAIYRRVFELLNIVDFENTQYQDFLINSNENEIEYFYRIICQYC